ncbi:RNA polymerase sigma-70 factor [Dyadobacter frigoris]|uniref:RNA polymerase sigma-70 factor n=1 Tax=Dyadobacter frigoris TaxID=2576211 RepID=A0A4U6D5U7_9BACT|nr:RNA polymerase sigma-70 factor [Dyadobacter frigoris]TKT91805.1 RNA polymerase sigma-70 factor [Dyadobacter frigoris]GLU53337.1 DNA-directed RNA polymerase sigma-70 factor [Dyadobacter frigoris]
MRDPLLHEEPKTENPFLSPSQEDKPRSQGIDSGLFLKTTFQENPSKGLELLFRRFYKPLCSHAVRFVYSKQIAEDLVSEVFFQFYRTKSYEHITSSYTSYLFRAVRNECFTHLRREFGKTDVIELTTENTISIQQQQPDAEIHYNHLFLKVNEVIGELPTQCRKVFLMSRFESKKYHEIARELNISPKTVEVHISKALKHLRIALNGEWILPCLLLLIDTFSIQPV